MITAQAFRNELDRTYDRMIDSQRQAVRSAIKLGAKILSCGRYHDRGLLCLKVTKPESWQGELWGRITEIECTIPTECEAATLAWVYSGRAPLAPNADI